MSKEIIKQENKGEEQQQPKPDFKMIQNENIVFKHKLDPNTGKIIKEEAIGGRLTVQKEPEEIQFFYDLSGYKTFEEEGFQPPASNERFDVKQRNSSSV